MAVASVALNTAQSCPLRAHFSFRYSTSITLHRRVEEEAVERVGSSVADEVIGVIQTPVRRLIVGIVRVLVVCTWDCAPAHDWIQELPWADHCVVLDVVVELVSIFDVYPGTAHVVQRVLRHSRGVRCMHDDAALLSVLHCVSMRNTCTTLAHEVEVDAVAAREASLATLLHASVLDVVDAT